jgi:predicted Zn-dependent peptidase
MQGMLYDLSINGPKIEQVERAKERYKLSVEYGKRYLAGFASILADVILAGFTYEDYLLYEKTLETITPEDIKNVVSIYLLKNPSVQIYSYPDRAK